MQAAQTDLQLYRKKREGDADRFQPYAFHRDHVGAADGAIALLALALAERAIGAKSGKRITRLIYGDEPLLAAALAAVRTPVLTAVN